MFFFNLNNNIIIYSIIIFFFIRIFILDIYKIPTCSMEPNIPSGSYVLIIKNINLYNIFSINNICKKKLNIKRGDLIVFKYPFNSNYLYVKRVIGISGDYIKYDVYNKKLYIKFNCINNNICKSNIFIFYKKNKKVSKNIFLIEENFFYNKNEYIFEKNKECNSYFINKKVNIMINLDYIDNFIYYYKQFNNKICEWNVPYEKYFVMGDNRDNSLDSRYFGFVSKTDIVGKILFIINFL